MKIDGELMDLVRILHHIEQQRDSILRVVKRLRDEGGSKYHQDFLRGVARNMGRLEDAEIESFLEARK